jgi:hypothetical protein
LAQPRPPQGNRTGLPDDLRSGIEALSGMDMSDVRVHYNAAMPAQLNALAYTQGREIHVGPGHEKHLPHEAWHVVQQAQGRVRPTMRMLRGERVNADERLEHEADVMGRRALRAGASLRQSSPSGAEGTGPSPVRAIGGATTIQRRAGFEFETHAHIYRTDHGWNELIADEAEIFHGVGWKLVSDSGRMEFVSDPFPTRAAFAPVIAAINAFIQNSTVALNTDIRAPNAGNWQAAAGPAGSVVKTSEDALNTQPVNAQTFYGHPQVSVGVRLESLTRFLARLRSAKPMAALRNQLFQDEYAGPAQANPLYPGTPAKRVEDVGKFLRAKDVERAAGHMEKARVLACKYRREDFNGAPVPSADMDKLEGLWQLMTHYWQWLGRYKTTSGYVKASLPAMARTDFHSMYQDLSLPAQQAFVAAKDYFVGRNIPMLGKTGQSMVEGHNFSIGEWYDSISNPASQHTFNNLVRNVDLVSDEQTIATGTNKSMGQMPMDVDPLAAVSRAVFELRHVTGGVNIPLAYLDPHILTPVFDLLAASNA